MVQSNVLNSIVHESVAAGVVQTIWQLWVVQSKVLNSAAYESVVTGGSTNDMADPSCAINGT